MKYAPTFLLTVLACASAAAVVTSKLYWGYWIAPPSCDFVVSTLASIERYTDFLCCEPPRSGPGSFAEVARFESGIHGDMPVGNLPAALLRHQLRPSSSEAVTPSVLEGVRATLQATGVLIDSTREYPHAKELWGHIAAGRDRNGTPMAIAGLFSGEVSNDHHVYYEAAFDISQFGTVKLLKWHRYYYDVAGLEGLAHWLAAFGGAIAGAITWAILSTARRRLTAAAPDGRTPNDAI